MIYIRIKIAVIAFIGGFVCYSISPVYGQEIQTDIAIKTLFSSGANLPFWMTSNQNGIFDRESSDFQYIDFNVSREFQLKGNTKPDYTFGLRTLGIRGNDKSFQLNTWFAGAKYKFLVLKAGAFPNQTILGGLSSSNGDLHWSNNTRPLPRVSLGTNNFIPVWFMPDWFSFDAVYEEFFLNDKRYVKNTHLHHKYVNLRFQLKPNLLFSVGLDHYSMWGGVHPTLGQLPQKIDDYFRYVLGLPGDEDFINMDQNLMAGNQMGKYRLKLEKELEAGQMVVYLDHPFDDRMNLSNIRDNMLGVYYAKNEQKGVVKLLYEFMYTNDQRVDKTAKDENGNYILKGFESYFIHHIYKSGMSYRYRMLSTPFSAPVTVVDGVNLGSGNNRIILHHFGLEAILAPNLKLRNLLSWSVNYGTFPNVYDLVAPNYFDGGRSQFSGITELNYYHPFWEMEFGLGIAYDKGEMTEDKVGVQFSVSKSW